MKKMLIGCIIVCLNLLAILSLINTIFILIGIITSIIAFFFITILFCLNNQLKKTNWYKNNFIYTSQFVSNIGYRSNLHRNYDIVNVGSNCGRFSFFYENIKGQNWSTGTQGPLFDFEILKYYFSYLKRGGIVLIPIVPFSSLSSYLDHNNASVEYLSKFSKILSPIQVQNFPKKNKLRMLIKFPIIVNFKYIKYLINDLKVDNRLEISEQPLQLIELESDAEKWIHAWKEEFNIKSLHDSISNSHLESVVKTAALLELIIEFCIERELKPVLVLPPMTKALSSKFPIMCRQQYIYDYVKLANKRSIPFLDYLDNDKFSDSSLYFNSFLLNLHGRKMFTKQVISDLGINNN